MAQSESSTQGRRRFLANAAKAAGAALVAHPLQALARIAAPGPLQTNREVNSPAAKQASAAALPSAGPNSQDAAADDAAWKRAGKSTWDAALAVLAGNIRTVPRYARPLLFEGSTYQGIWQECGPHEGLVYATLAKHVPAGQGIATPLEAARNNHKAFFELQRPDGQLPASVKMTETGYGQIRSEERRVGKEGKKTASRY